MSQSRFRQYIRPLLIDITNDVMQYLTTRFKIPNEIIDIIANSVDHAIKDPRAMTYLRTSYRYVHASAMYVGRHVVEIVIGSERHHGLVTGTLQVVSRAIRLIEQLLCPPFSAARDAALQASQLDWMGWKNRLELFIKIFTNKTIEWGPFFFVAMLGFIPAIALFLVEQAIKGISAAIAWIAEQIIVKGILQYLTEPLVSKDFYGSSYSCIFDAELTKVMGGKLVKIMGWYDNEWAYSCRVVDLCEYIIKKGI